jgi:hypothetical protein
MWGARDYLHDLCHIAAKANYAARSMANVRARYSQGSFGVIPPRPRNCVGYIARRDCGAMSQVRREAAANKKARAFRPGLPAACWECCVVELVLLVT